MTDFIKRLRDGATNIHSIGPARAADLLREAAEVLEALGLQPMVAGEWDTKPQRATEQTREALRALRFCRGPSQPEAAEDARRASGLAATLDFAHRHQPLEGEDE